MYITPWPLIAPAPVPGERRPLPIDLDPVLTAGFIAEDEVDEWEAIAVRICARMLFREKQVGQIQGRCVLVGTFRFALAMLT